MGTLNYYLIIAVSIATTISIIGTFVRVGQIVELLKQINSKMDAQKINKKDE